MTRCALWYRDWEAPDWVPFRPMPEKECDDALYTAFKLGKWHEYVGICLEDGGAPFDAKITKPQISMASR